MVVSFELGHGEESDDEFKMSWVVFLVPKWATLLLPQYLFYKYKGNQKEPYEIVDSYVIIYPLKLFVWLAYVGIIIHFCADRMMNMSIVLWSQQMSG